MSTVKNDIQSTGYTGQGNSVGTLQGTNGETSTIVPSDKEWDDMWENLSKPQTQSEILDQRETVNLQKDEQQTSTSETSDAEIAHTDQPEDSNKPSGSEPASINANNPEESDASKIENASTSGTTDAQGIDKSEQTAAEEVAPGITHDKVNDAYQVEAGGVRASFKNLEDAKAYQENLTGFVNDGEGQQIELLNYRSDLQDVCQDGFISGIIGSIMHVDRVVVGNGKTLKGLQQRTDSTAKQTLEEAKAKGQDKFWGCQAPDKGKLMAAKLMKEQQGLVASKLINPNKKLEEELQSLEQGEKPKLDKLELAKNQIKMEIDELDSELESVQAQTAKLQDVAKKLGEAVDSLQEAIENLKTNKLTTGLGKFLEMVSNFLSMVINVLQQKCNDLDEKRMKLPNEVKAQLFTEFVKNAIDLSTKKDYHATFLEGTLETDSIPGRRTYSSMLDGLSTAIRYLLGDESKEITAATLENFAKTYGEKNLLEAIKAACTLPDSRDKVLQAFHEYWGNNHSKEEPCPYVLVLEKGLNSIALEYQDLLKREKTLTEELKEYSGTDRINTAIRENLERSISPELQKISAQKSELEKKFDEYKRDNGKIEGDAYVLNIGSRTIMTQPDQAGIITLKSLGAFAEKLPESPVKQPAA